MIKSVLPLSTVTNGKYYVNAFYCEISFLSRKEEIGSISLQTLRLFNDRVILVELRIAGAALLWVFFIGRVAQLFAFKKIKFLLW